jgi:uncharacterized protein YjiS (DUF1127 family)
MTAIGLEAFGLRKEDFMELIGERMTGGFGRGWMSELRARMAKASRRHADARAKRRAERNMARFVREVEGMSEHMRRDIGLEPRLFHAHFTS